MAYLHWLAHEIAGVVRANRFWMTWNLLLAGFPAALALVLFARPHRRTLGWWVGVGVFALFLPNAPYVLTDLLHLRGDVSSAASDGVVVAGVLPLYGAFVLAGFIAYLISVELAIREVRSVRPGLSRWPIELAIHLVCSIGVVVGRISRLNSWDTAANPSSTAERIFSTLTWRGAPVAVAAVFVAVVLTYGVVRILVTAVAHTTASLYHRLRPAPAVA